MKRKLKAGRWLVRALWMCLCNNSYSANWSSCPFCHAQRPRKGFGGGRPR